MSFTDFVGIDDFGFDFPQSFVRQRAAKIPDPYNPDSSVDDWGNPEEITVSGFLSSTSSTEQTGNEVRAEVISDAQLIITDPNVDVQCGDRIVQDGKKWIVQGFPPSDQNPFTGWQPTLVANLEEVQG